MSPVSFSRDDCDHADDDEVADGKREGGGLFCDDCDEEDDADEEAEIDDEALEVVA